MAWIRVTHGFDSRKARTYHCSLMPRSLYAWYSLNALEILGHRQVQIVGEIEFKRLTRLRELLQSEQGSVRVGFKFGQQAAGYTTVRLEYDASFKLKCQRCLEPMEEQVASRISYALVGDESIPSGVPKDHEAIELSGDRFQPATFVEDELIMSLPLIPRHTRIEQCGVLAKSVKQHESQSGSGSGELRSRVTEEEEN